MVEHIRQSGRVGAVSTPTRVRSVKRERNARERRDQKSEDGTRDSEMGDREAAAQAPHQPSADSNAVTGKRINVVI